MSVLHLHAREAAPSTVCIHEADTWLEELPHHAINNLAPSLFLIPFTEDPLLLSKFEQRLLPEDRPRIDHMKNERGRRGQVQTRAILRILLNTVLKRQDWTIRPSAHEKPILELPDGSTPLHFNLSHSRRHLFIGLHPTRPIGVDIETPEREVKWEGVSRMVFTQSERDWIFADEQQHLRKRFFRAWTCKEAVMKAEGAGFLKSPQRIEIDFQSESPAQDVPTVNYCQIDHTPLAWCVL